MNTPFEPEKPRGPGLFVRLRASFITGLIVYSSGWSYNMAHLVRRRLD